ncbi:MAG: hypothetical protein ACXAEU_12315 [Candidatus Hodarchaeales archaeon]
MRKIFPVFILSVILFFAMNYVVLDTGAMPSLISEDNDISVLHPEMFIKEPGSQEDYVNVESLLTETTIPSVKDGSSARFQASVRNIGEENIQLRTFRISMFNETAEVQTFEKTYPTDTISREELFPMEIKTDRVEGAVSLNETEINYKFRFTFGYVTEINPNITEVHSAKNITISVALPDSVPPIFILWGIGFFSSVLILMCLLGYYGNRKKKSSEALIAKQ